MGEYQYYEFQALDQPLSGQAREHLKTLSSRVQLTATSASFVYNFGDFRNSPYQVLASYFDMMLYITNWGTRQLMFRFPAGTIPAVVQQSYQYADDEYMDNLKWTVEGDYIILNMVLYEVEYDGWLEGEGMLTGMIRLRDDILRGDYRVLYLAWLKIASDELVILEEAEDLFEPPVPPGLQPLSVPLKNFIDFFEIDRDLVTAAAKESPPPQQSAEVFKPVLERLPDAEKLDFLTRLLAGESALHIKLAQRLRELSGNESSMLPPESGERRSIRELNKLSKAVRKQRKAAEKQAARAAHQQRMEELAPKEEALWKEVHTLIKQKQTKPYKQAVAILVDLQALAKFQGKMSQFQAQIQAILEQFPTLRGLHNRMEKANLM